jgi:hypothetical protein
MMKIRFAKIPKLAIVFYVIGFAILGFTIWAYYGGSKMLTAVQFQQLFIIGALTVTVGSAINIARQFRKK